MAAKLDFCKTPRHDGHSTLETLTNIICTRDLLVEVAAGHTYHLFHPKSILLTWRLGRTRSIVVVLLLNHLISNHYNYRWLNEHRRNDIHWTNVTNCYWYAVVVYWSTRLRTFWASTIAYTTNVVWMDRDIWTKTFDNPCSCVLWTFVNLHICVVSMSCRGMRGWEGFLTRWSCGMRWRGLMSAWVSYRVNDFGGWLKVLWDVSAWSSNLLSCVSNSHSGEGYLTYRLPR